MSSDEWLAYVDESEPNPRFDPNSYILAAAIVERARVPDGRSATSSWRDPARHASALSADDGSASNSSAAAFSNSVWQR